MKKVSSLLLTTILFTTLSFKTVNSLEDDFEYSGNEAIVCGQVIGINYKLNEYFVFDTFTKSNPIRRGSILKRIIYKHPKTKKTTSFIVKDDSQVKELYKLNDDLKINIVVQRNDKLEIVNTNIYHLRHTKLENTIYSYATLTSVNPNTFEYTAVAHGIQIGGNSNYRIKEGFIYLADTVYNAKKSRSLSRGNIDADISNKPIGTVTTASN